MATVIAPYEATSSEQLSLQKGQLVMIRKKTDSGWWEGELQVSFIKNVFISIYLYLCLHNIHFMFTYKYFYAALLTSIFFLDERTS